MNTNLNSLGYDLYEITKDEWILYTKGGPIFPGTFKDVIRYAVKNGFELEELTVAVTMMAREGDNAAHFGMHRTFIRTFNRDLNGRKVG